MRDQALILRLLSRFTFGATAPGFRPRGLQPGGRE